MIFRADFMLILRITVSFLQKTHWSFKGIFIQLARQSLRLSHQIIHVMVFDVNLLLRRSSWLNVPDELWF